MSYKVITGPAAEPITLEFAKEHLRVDFTDDDNLITQIIKSARDYCEQYSGRVLMQQTVEKSFDRFPIDAMNEPLELEGAPVQSVTSIKYQDVTDNETTWDAANYKVSHRNELAYITPKNNQCFPSTLIETDAVTIRYVIGYETADDVPGAFIQAMLLMIGKMYEYREDTMKSAPSHSEWLMSPYKVYQ